MVAIDPVLLVSECICRHRSFIFDPMDVLIIGSSSILNFRFHGSLIERIHRPIELGSFLFHCELVVVVLVLLPLRITNNHHVFLIVSITSCLYHHSISST